MFVIFGTRFELLWAKQTKNKKGGERAMTLIKFEPFKEFETLTDRVQRIFDELPTFPFNMVDSFSPRIDISEDDKHIYIDAEIPGVNKKDLKITLQDNILTIQGEKKREEEKKEKNFFRSERLYGTFQRSFTLPVEVDTDHVDAKFKDGMLHIKLNKIETKKSKEKLIELK